MSQFCADFRSASEALSYRGWELELQKERRRLSAAFFRVTIGVSDYGFFPLPLP